MNNTSTPSEFRAVFTDTRWHDGFYRFLQNIYRLYPEDRFHLLIKRTSLELTDDEAIYRRVQRELPKIKPFLADLRLALPSLFKQKREMADQTLRLLGKTQSSISGYTEIGSTGRYISELRKRITITGPIFLVNELAATNSPVDIAERGGFAKIGQFVKLDYEPLSAEIADHSMDLVTCYIGLHHCPLHKLDAFIRSIKRVLRPGGTFILRDHDVTTPEMFTFVSLVHTVFNAGLNETWEKNQCELRYFKPIAEWVMYLGDRGLHDSGQRQLQAHDPSDNVLLAFTKTAV